MDEEYLSRLLKIQHYLATRVPRIVLQRVDEIFPCLKESVVSVLF
jgi:hypothetical protein